MTTLESPVEHSSRWAVALVATLFGAVLCTLAFARFTSFHNETFDLAFYTRMAWGLPRGSFWDPIVNAHVFGLHISPALVPLGFLGMVFGTAEVLLAAQTLAVAAAAFPIAKIGQRHFGRWGLLLAFVWFAYPNLGHVATYEFHPATMAVLPLAWLLDAVDRKDGRAAFWWTVAVLLFREDLGLATGIACLLASRGSTSATFARAGAGLSFLWVLVFLFVLHPMYGPENGSLSLHFGQWGDSTSGVLAYVVTHPLEVLGHFGTQERLLYLPLLLLPLGFLPALSWRAALIASPLLAINLLSSWPTAVELDSHYQTPLLPILLFGAVEGAKRLRQTRLARASLPALGVCSGVAMFLIGGYPWSLDFKSESFQWSEDSAHAAAVVRAVPDRASVQAPYALMPHLAERVRLGPAPPPDRNTDIVVLDLIHRERHRGTADLLRTDEEPTARGWFGRQDYGLVALHGRFALLQRGADPRASLGAFWSSRRQKRYQRLTECLEIADAEIRDGNLRLHFHARRECPQDLAVRFGTARRPTRVELLFDGVVSPATLRAGDLLVSVHALDPVEEMELRLNGLRVGVIRQSGARPVHKDPVSVAVPVN